MLRPTPLLTLLLLGIATVALADGEIRLGERVLERSGPEGRHYCEGDEQECARIKTKMLSGYTFLPGYLSMGISGAAQASSSDETDGPRGAARLQLNTVGVAFAGGEMELGRLEVIGELAPERLRLRAAFMDARALFFCHDYQDDRLRLPFFGMMSNACRPDTVVGLDAGLLALQWDSDTGRLIGEWAKLGLAFELFANGHGYSRLLRSLTLAPLLDVRSIEYGQLSGVTGLGGQTSLGLGGRLGMLFRTPRWELRLDGRYRVPLAAERGALQAHELSSELRLVHNFLVGDGLVASFGLQFSLDYAHSPPDGLGAFGSQQRKWGGFSGLLLGWRHEPPRI